MKMKPLRILTVISMALPISLHARTWKEAGSERALEGEFQRVENGQVIIVRANGTSVNIPLAKLSEDDKKFVSAQSAPKVEAPVRDVFKWETDVEVAKKRAKEENKEILADFTGSDWCGWCMKLKKEVFDQPQFHEYAKKHLVLLELDFPRTKKLPAKEKEQNEKLADEFNVRGYPTILLLNARGKEIHRTGYMAGGAEKYVEHLKALLK